MQAKSVSSEERLWAALAHGSAILLIFGPILPVVVWFTQREKSAFARFHALQAMAYQILFFWAWLVLMPIVMICGFVVLIPLAGLAEQNATHLDLAFPLFPFAIWGVIFFVIGLYVLGGLVATGFALTGREFRYPILGSWLARFLGYDPAVESRPDQDKEERFVAAIGHSTSILLLWGLVVPLVVWITQKDRSAFLRFQALQAAIYQGLGTLAYFVLMAAYMFFAFAMVGAAAATSGFQDSQLAAGVGVLVIVPMLCFMAVFFVAGPLYQLFAIIASIKVLRGRDYHYPWLGRLIAARAGNAPLSKEAAPYEP